MADAKCPYCKELIEYIKFSANYTEQGNCRGTVAFDGSDEESDDSDSNGYETEDHDYRCPLCNHDITWQQMENLEAIQNDEDLPNNLEEGFEYYRETDGEPQEGGEPEKEVEAVGEDGISVAPFTRYPNVEIQAYKCSKCGADTPVEVIGITKIDVICRCGKELNEENSIIIKY